MASEYTLSIDVDAPPDVTWSIVGDLTAVPRWFVKYVECTVEGEIRTLRSADGAELVERLLDRDDDERRYAYTVIAGPPLASHEASFRVLARDGGSTIMWHTNATFLDASIDTEARLGAAQRDGLERLKQLCEEAGAA
jgi:Polyketide cyclase / dehydrase and lipid transport